VSQAPKAQTAARIGGGFRYQFDLPAAIERAWGRVRIDFLDARLELVIRGFNMK
jgi:hypothetical protein